MSRFHPPVHLAFLQIPRPRNNHHSQRPKYFGPGVEPKVVVGTSASTPWTSIYPTPWRPVGPLAWQSPWSQPATRKWDKAASAGFVPRGRLPYPNPPFEHQNYGFLSNASFAPSSALFSIGSHSSNHPATKTLDRLVAPIQGANPRIDDTNAGEIVGPGIVPASTHSSDERYQYFPERGVRSRSSPPRSRSQSRSPIRNIRPQSSPP